MRLFRFLAAGFPALASSAFFLAAGLSVADPINARKWEGEIARMEAADKANPPPRDLILFTGSSSIRLWNLKKSFPDLPVVNHGFGGSNIRENDHFLPRLVVPLHPQTIVFYAGDNDSSQGRTAKQIADDFQEYAWDVHRLLPESHLYFLPIKPSIARWKLRPLQAEANRRIRRFCLDRPNWLTFIDLEGSILGPDGNPDPRFFQKDGLHLNDAGYARWAPIVRAALGPVGAPQPQPPATTTQAAPALSDHP